MEKQQPGQKRIHHGERHPEKESHGKQITVHTNSSPRHPKRLPTHFGTRQVRPQWFQKNLCITQKQVPLEGHEEISTSTLH